MHALLLSLPGLLACKTKPGNGDDSGDTGPIDDGKQRLTLLDTNDWHSHALGWGPLAEYTPATTGDDDTIGGMARVSTLANDIRGSETHPVLLLDAGDWMSGDALQLLGPTQAAELQIMQAMHYDATTLGNHEFDWGPVTLSQIIAAGDAHGVTLPILATNVVPAPTDPADDALQAHFDSGRIVPTLVETLDNGLTIGMFGLIGDEAGGLAPGAVPTTFSPAIDAAAAAVADLRAQGVDIVIAIAHNGVTDDPATSPDEILATEVPGIDVIVGGHTHTPLVTPRTVGNTVIIQAGSYSRYLGQLDLAWDGTSWTVEGYQLHDIDDSIQGDPAITSLVDGFINDLDSGPLAALGHSYQEPIVSVPGNVGYTECAESEIGNFLTDAYMYDLNRLAEDPIQVAFEAQGVIRDGFTQGASGVQAFSDMFRVLPLGQGLDDRPGYPLVDFYVTAAELSDACEVTASVSPFFGCNYFVEHSGMRCTMDMVNTPFARVTQIELWQGGDWVTLDTSASNPNLYHVAVDSYVASLMGTLEGLTSGLLVITPKDITGAPFVNLQDAVFDANPATPETDELKLWQALIDYATSLPDTSGDGMPDVPDQYLAPAGRIVGYH